MLVDIRDVITCFKFGDDRFRGLTSAESQILPFPIDFDGRPYNTHTQPCERVIPLISMAPKRSKFRKFLDLENFSLDFAFNIRGHGENTPYSS